MTSSPAAPLEAGVRPRRLRQGDVVALIAPSGPVPPEQLDAGTAILRSWGLEVREMPHVRHVHPVHAYLAGADEGRAEDFSVAWAAPDVRAIVRARRVRGAADDRSRRLVGAARAEPTVLLGYSDVTALQEAVAARLGVVTLHGPMSGTRSFLGSAAAQVHLRTTLFEPESVQVLSPPSARRWWAAPRSA